MAKKNSNSSYENILKEAASSQKTAYSFKKTYPAYIILLLALAITLIAWQFIGQRIHKEQYNAFDKAATSVMNRFEAQYDEEHEVLMSMHQLYDIYVEVVRDIFELYGSIPIESQPSILSVAYASKVSNRDLPSYIHYIRSQGFYDYNLHPPGVRDYYYPIDFIVPLEENLHRSGYDFVTDPLTKNAIEKARDSNRIVATEIYQLRSKDTVGFYLIAPVFHRDSSIKTMVNRRRSFQGSVMLEILSPKFFEEALDQGVASDTSIYFRCTEVDSQFGDETVYYSYNYNDYKNDDPLLTDVRSFNIADREIKVHFATIPAFGGQLQSILPYIVLVAGLILSFAFFGFVMTVITRKTAAVDLAERMTRSQRRIVDSSNDVIAVLSYDGKWRSMNSASKNIFGYDPDDMTGRKIDRLFWDEAEKNKFYKLIDDASDERTQRLELRMKNSDGEMKWIGWSFTISQEDEMVYCIGRDVTLEKKAEAEANLRRKENQLTSQLREEASAFKTYFMVNLSHQLHNSLTGIIGYLQLLEQRIYENEEERQNFVELARTSSEELFSFLSDIDEIAEQGNHSVDINIMTLGDVLDNAILHVEKDKLKNQEISVKKLDTTGKTHVLADKKRMAEAFNNIFLTLSDGLDKSDIQIVAQENPYEGATEIQITAPPNKKVQEMIELYKSNITSLIDILKQDKNDILFRFAQAASNIRIMNGTMKIETFGEGDNNIVLINMPMKKQTKKKIS